MVPLTLALGASVAWGASDFVGGLASRHLPVVSVLLGAQAVGLALAAIAWLLTGAQLPAAEVMALAGIAGIAELLGFASCSVGWRSARCRPSRRLPRWRCSPARYCTSS